MSLLAAIYSLKEQFAHERQFSPDLLTTMPMDNRVKFRSPQNVSGASQQNRAGACSKGDRD